MVEYRRLLCGPGLFRGAGPMSETIAPMVHAYQMAAASIREFSVAFGSLFAPATQRLCDYLVDLAECGATEPRGGKIAKRIAMELESMHGADNEIIKHAFLEKMQGHLFPGRPLLFDEWVADKLPRATFWASWAFRVDWLLAEFAVDLETAKEKPEYTPLPWLFTDWMHQLVAVIRVEKVNDMDAAMQVLSLYNNR